MGFFIIAINTILNLAHKSLKFDSETFVYFASFFLNLTQKWDYFDEAKNNALFVNLLYKIIDEFLASKSNYLLDKKIEIDKFK